MDKISFVSSKRAIYSYYNSFIEFLCHAFAWVVADFVINTEDT